MKSAPASFPAFGIDTIQPLDHEACRFLVQRGFAFAVRYLGKLTSDELAIILCHGLALMPVTTSRKAGWMPDAEMGRQDGERATSQLKALVIPTGTTVWLDLEGSGGTAERTAAWVNAWAEEVTRNGYEAGLYVGAGCVLSADELYRLPQIRRYWRSCSRVPEPTRRGFCMAQLRPWNVRVGPLTVDVDVIEEDWLGCVPTWVVGP